MTLFELSTTLGLYFSAIFDALVQILGSTVGSVDTVWRGVLDHYAAVFAEYGANFPNIAEPLDKLWDSTDLILGSFNLALSPIFGAIDKITELLSKFDFTLPFANAINNAPILALLVATGVVVSVILMVYGAIISLAKMALAYLPL